MLPQPSIKCLECIICGCTKARCLSLALPVHLYLCSTGLHAHNYLGNFLLSMLADVGSMPNAVKIFHMFPVKERSRWDHLINGYLKNGEEKHALMMFQRMQQECAVHLSSHTLVALLKACAKLKDVKRGQFVHDRISELLQTDVYIGGALVDMYGKCGFLERAREVFDMLPVVNVIIWNALIGGHVCHGKNRDAIILFEEMQAKGVSPNPVTYVLSIKACGSAGAAEKGSRIHHLIAEQGLLSNPFICSALINMYVECGSLEKAQDLFEALSPKDVASWNALIAGYSKHEHGEEALYLYHQMQLQGVPPNAATYACIVKSCGSIGEIDKANEVHAEIERRGLHKLNVFIGSGLVNMYAQCGAFSKAQEVFDLLSIRNVVTWNALIAGYAYGNHDEEALYCFERMKSEGINPTAVTYACSLKACGSVGAADKGIAIHEEVSRKGLLKENIFVGSALVAMYAKCGFLDKAQDVFDVLLVRNSITWSALITGYAQLGRVENALSMFEKMLIEGSKPDKVVLVGILHACSHSGLLESAQTYFEAISEDYGIPPCLTHHSCMVDLLGRAGQIESAMEVMNRTPFHPNLVTWLSVLGACQKWGDVVLGRHAFDQAICLDKEVDSAYVCMYNIYADTHVYKV